MDALFSDMKGRYVFNYLDDLVVYSRSVNEHIVYVNGVLERLQEAEFNLNLDKMNIEVSNFE